MVFMKIEFLGADREVTGSCHYVAFGETHFLVDCGMEQGADLYVNQEIPVNPATIDYVFVTHAHIDHSDFSHFCIITGSGERFLQQRQPVNCVISC